MIKLINKYSKTICYILAFIIPVLFMLIISDALNFSPFGNTSPLVADTSVQFEPYISYLKTVFFGNNDMFYTFSKTIGGDMAGFSFYYLGNPFMYLLVFLPNRLMPAGILFMIILLMALSSLNFNIMLNRIYGFRWSSLMFSVSYAFIGYYMAYYNFIIYFNNIMLLPLIILGLYELVVKEKKSFIYIIFLSASIITNYYMGYMTCIFCGLFFIYLIFTGKKEKEIRNIKKHLRILGTFFFETLLSVLISSVALFTVVYSLMSGQKMGDGFGLKIARGTNFRIFDVFAGLFSISFNGNISDGLPIIYIGTLGVVFVFLYFMNREIKLKEKIASLVMIFIFVISFYVKFINRIWHGMAETVGFPYRYSFFLSFFLLFIGYKAFILMKQGTRKYNTAVIFGIFVIYSAYLYITKNEYVGALQIILTGSFLCMYLVGVYAICYKREYMYPITIGFFMIMSFDILLNGHHSISRYYGSNPEKETVEYYDDYYQSLKGIIGYVESDYGRNDGVYRVDKLFRWHNNDAMLVGYNGMSHFSSTEDSKVIELMNRLGYCTNNMWSYYGEDGNTAFADSLFNLRYLLSQYDGTAKPYELLDIVNDKYVFKNPYALEIAFASTADIDDIECDKFNHFTLQNEIAKKVAGEPYGIYRPVEVIGEKHVNVEKYENTYTRINSSEEAYVEYQLRITSPDFIYMYFNAPSYQQAKVEVNGMGKKDYFTTYSFSTRWCGYFSKGEVIPVRIYLEQDEIEIDGYEFYYENAEELKRWYEDVTSSEIRVTKKSSSIIDIDADIKEGKDKLVLSVPYDKGWHVYVDGKETETEPTLDILLSFDIKEGKHQISLRYIPRGFILGSLFTIIGIIILITVFIIERIRIKRILNKERI